MAPSLCLPIILGLPFLKHNHIVVDTTYRTAVHFDSGLDLLHPYSPLPPDRVPMFKEKLRTTEHDFRSFVDKLKNFCVRPEFILIVCVKQ